MIFGTSNLQRNLIPIKRVVVGDDGDKSDIISPEQVQEENGTMVNSGFLDGMDIHSATDKIMDYMEDQRMGVRVTNYRIRDWSVSRQRYWGAPIPIINCDNCGPVLVPDDQLPVILPELTDFKPSGDGRSALARATEWLKVQCPKCGGEAERETDTLDTYICSSWYMLRYMDPHNDKAAFGPEITNKWMPIDFYNGADHATAHMIYARFVTRFFHKKGLLDNPEPFKKFLFNGKVTAADGQMFSKSKGNGVDPLEIINSGYGADALRTYLMFASPLELWTKWDANGVPGCFRFLNRVFNLVQEFIEQSTGDETEKDQSSDTAPLKITHIAIKKVSEDLEGQRYNTAIAAMMKATNELYELKAKFGFKGHAVWREALEIHVMLIAPFAPHTAEQLWHDLGHNDSVNKDNWPELKQEYLVNDTIKIAVQVNGKLRAVVEVKSDADEEEIKLAAFANENVQNYTKGQATKKVIYVKGRMLSIVV
jgi:leucyl-tRNA synthetase